MRAWFDKTLVTMALVGLTVPPLALAQEPTPPPPLTPAPTLAICAPVDPDLTTREPFPTLFQLRAVPCGGTASQTLAELPPGPTGVGVTLPPVAEGATDCWQAQPVPTDVLLGLKGLIDMLGLDQ